MLCTVASVDCTRAGAATPSFKDLVTLHRRTQQQIFWRRSPMASARHGNSWPGVRTPLTKHIAERCRTNQQHKLCLDDTYHFTSFCASLDWETEKSWTFNVTFGVFWYYNYDEWTYCTPLMMRGVLYASYDERTYCTPLMMRGVLYATYDERTYCTLVMMRGRIVCQLWWGDILYASYDEGRIVHQLWWGSKLCGSYDEGAFCMPVMMRGHIVHQLGWGSKLCGSYDEGAYCTPVRMRGSIVAS